MKKKRLFILLLLTAALALPIGAAGGADDPLVTLSRLKTLLLQPTESYIESRAEEIKKELLGTNGTGAVDKEALAKQAAASLGGDSVSQVRLTKGQRVSGPIGGGFILTDGEATVTSLTASDLIDISAGQNAVPGTTVKKYGYYIIGVDNGCGMTVTSDIATIKLLDGAFARDGYTPSHMAEAQALEAIGIFRGSDKGLELDRAPTRQESLIMLIRLLGQEPEALAYNGVSPFKDLTGWADGRKYVAYGAHMGYTNGVTADTFNQYGSADRHVFITYVLRAMGYSDKNGDFVWNTTSDALAVKTGLLTQKELDAMNESGFFRDHVALISHRALKAKIKDGSMTLGEQLAVNGRLSWDAYFNLK